MIIFVEYNLHGPATYVTQVFVERTMLLIVEHLMIEGNEN